MRVCVCVCVCEREREGERDREREKEEGIRKERGRRDIYKEEKKEKETGSE